MMRQTTVRRVGLVLCIALSTCAQFVWAEDRPAELMDVPGPWVRYHWNEITELRDLLISAYGISEDDRPAFLHLYYDAWRAYRDHHVRFSEMVDVNDSPDDAARKLTDFIANSPISHPRLFRLTESILPEGNYVECRHRFEELVERGTQFRYRSTGNRVENDEFIRAIQAVRPRSKSPVGEDGRPMPASVFQRMTGNRFRPLVVGEIIKSPETCIEPMVKGRLTWGVFERPKRREKPRVLGVNFQPGDANGKLPETIAGHSSSGLSTANSSRDGNSSLISPAEDTWLRNVRQVASNCLADGKISPANRTAIVDLLEEITRRVRKARAGREGEYRALGKITSRREFNRALSELDQVLDGLMAEFNCRLSQLCPAGSIKTS